MKPALLAAGAAALVAACAGAYIVVDPFGAEPGPSAERALTGSACRRLAGLAGQLAEEDRDAGAFLAALGRDAAGIRRGSRGFVDLLRGGHNTIRGRGFRDRFDDGSDGQVRHFAGIAMATLFASGDPTRWISEHLRRDGPGSADGRLTDEAIAFARAVLSGGLALADTPDWILANLCRRGA
jgi:hypothetical protein